MLEGYSRCTEPVLLCGICGNLSSNVIQRPLRMSFVKSLSCQVQQTYFTVSVTGALKLRSFQCHHEIRLLFYNFNITQRYLGLSVLKTRSWY